MIKTISIDKPLASISFTETDWNFGLRHFEECVPESFTISKTIVQALTVMVKVTQFQNFQMRTLTFFY